MGRSVVYPAGAIRSLFAIESMAVGVLVRISCSISQHYNVQLDLRVVDLAFREFDS